ncbi:MAG: putative toxin-antitoxin system toxin component, PIN family [Candidatus Dechloromonas phosphoritropha]|jgi:putative PIN family toxin of toxin-antitoxin system
MSTTDLPGIVFDTNALVSAAILPSSLSRRALLFAAENFRIAHSSATWFELSEVIAREKFDRYFPGESRIDFLLVLARISQFIEPSVSITDCIDPSDNRFLELALCAESEIIISGDDHLRSMNPWRGIAIASPSEFLQRYA